MDLFDNQSQVNSKQNIPLAVRMRPESLDGFFGQEELLSETKLLHRLIKSSNFGSIILYGPPGTGKTTIAHIISKHTGNIFKQINAVTSNVSELRSIIDVAKKMFRLTGRRTILFVDEIHRFNKAQQDVLLPDIENNSIEFIGATTQNPCLVLTSPLISRSHIFQFKPLSNNALVAILKRALTNTKIGLGDKKISIQQGCLKRIATLSDGDARRALNILEITVKIAKEQSGCKHISITDVEASAQKKWVIYDRQGDSHYDTISAFIKSMRGSDPDASVYWLAKMIEAGEDPRFIARRIVIFASEDIGNADPIALNIAVSAFQTLNFIGMPEAQLALTQAAIYMATAPKSNAITKAIGQARKEIKQNQTRPIPDHLRDSHYFGASRFGAGKGYIYPHDYPEHQIKQDYGVQNRKFYIPSNQGFEKIIARRLARWKQHTQKMS